VARTYLLLEPAGKGRVSATQQLESGELEIEVTEVAGAHQLAQAAAAVRNLVRASETKAQASSQASDSPASAAVDGRESSAWTCAPEDKTPSLTLEFERPLKANQISFSLLGGRQESRGQWDRATKLELRINKMDSALSVTLDSDESKTTQYELGRQIAIRSLEIKIVERAIGTKHPGRVGFNEIALYYQPPIKK